MGSKSINTGGFMGTTNLLRSAALIVAAILVIATPNMLGGNSAQTTVSLVGP